MSLSNDAQDWKWMLEFIFLFSAWFCSPPLIVYNGIIICRKIFSSYKLHTKNGKLKILKKVLSLQNSNLSEYKIVFIRTVSTSIKKIQEQCKWAHKNILYYPYHHFVYRQYICIRDTQQCLLSWAPWSHFRFGKKAFFIKFKLSGWHVGLAAVLNIMDCWSIKRKQNCCDLDHWCFGSQSQLQPQKKDWLNVSWDVTNFHVPEEKTIEKMKAKNYKIFCVQKNKCLVHLPSMQ